MKYQEAKHRSVVRKTVSRFKFVEGSVYEDDLRLSAQIVRKLGFKTRIVYRGPRPQIKCWRSGKMITPGYTLKRDAVAADLYYWK